MFERLLRGGFDEAQRVVVKTFGSLQEVLSVLLRRPR